MKTQIRPWVDEIQQGISARNVGGGINRQAKGKACGAPTRQADVWSRVLENETNNLMPTKMMKCRPFPFFMIAGVFLLAGCSTPATRIQANPEAFARLEPQEQALVQAGQISLGFDADAVKLALGDPDRRSVRSDADGETEIWHYVSYEAEGRMLYTGNYHTGRRWWGWGPLYPYYLDYPDREVRDRFHVEFRGGRVSAITQDLPAR